MKDLQQRLLIMPRQERVEWLGANSEERVLKKVAVPLVLEEISELRQKLSDQYAEHKDIRQEKKEVDKNYNEQLKTIKAEMDELVEKVRSGYQMQETHVFSVINDTTMMLEDYTMDGTLVGSRPIPRNFQRGLRAVNED